MNWIAAIQAAVVEKNIFRRLLVTFPNFKLQVKQYRVQSMETDNSAPQQNLQKEKFDRLDGTSKPVVSEENNYEKICK